jgi:glycosyltransferase involved in cell wall biosynthesis
MTQPSATIRCAVVPPVAAPYREPLFAALHAEHPELELSVIYQASTQPSWDAPDGFFETDHSYPARHLESWQRARPGRTPIVWPRGLERELQEANPDAVVAWEYGPASARALRWCRSNKRAYVVFTECIPQTNDLLSVAQLQVHRWIALRADGLIAASSAARDRLLEFGIDPERITVALQSADLDGIRAAARASDLEGIRHAVAASGAEAGSTDARAVRVLTVGRLVPDKNQATLLDAFARVLTDQSAAADPDAKAIAELRIVGEGPLEGQLQEVVAKQDLPVEFDGHLERDELAARYAESDVFALVSSYEPFGVAVREAVAAGLPIICSRRAGAAGDVAIDGRNAILIDPYPADCARALARLLSDAELRGRMAAASHEIDEETRGQDIEAFATAVVGAAARRGRGQVGPAPSSA